MEVTDLRIALFSGNYNYVRDGANQALNRLVEYLLNRGAQVRIYSPTTDTPAFEPKGELVSIPSFAVPLRPEYRIAYRLSDAVKRDIEAFAPNIVHVSSPDLGAQNALKWARLHKLPVLASVHTRFESYLRYYHLGFLEPCMVAILRRFYRKCDALVVPTESFADLLRRQNMNDDIGIWSRGIDKTRFNPEMRDLQWRRNIGFADDDMVIVFLGRLVIEKGLNVFARVAEDLEIRNVKSKLLVIGEGPAHADFQKKMPNAYFTGHLAGNDLSRAIASGDVLLNPSVTEAFGNVTSEAMACGLPIVAAIATGNSDLVKHGKTGYLVPGELISQYADHLQEYAENPTLRLAHGRAGYVESLKYDWDTINQAVVDAYIRLIQERRGAEAQDG
jgi:phosphatidylinositol alpha 1,6-mannosyltransferase